MKRLATKWLARWRYLVYKHASDLPFDEADRKLLAETQTECGFNAHQFRLDHEAAARMLTTSRGALSRLISYHKRLFATPREIEAERAAIAESVLIQSPEGIYLGGR